MGYETVAIAKTANKATAPGEPSYQPHSNLHPIKMIFRLTKPPIALPFNVTLLFNVALILAIATPSVTAAPQTTKTTDNQKLIQLVQTATKTQKSGNLKLAASQWQAVWEQFPDSELSSSARFQAGFCHQQLRNYPQAIDCLLYTSPSPRDS